MVSPHGVVARIDLVVVVPVGHLGAAGLAERFSPEDIVGGVDDAAAVEIAGHAGQHVDVLLDPGNGRVIEYAIGSAGFDVSNTNEHRIGDRAGRSCGTARRPDRCRRPAKWRCRRRYLGVKSSDGNEASHRMPVSPISPPASIEFVPSAENFDIRLVEFRERVVRPWKRAEIRVGWRACRTGRRVACRPSKTSFATAVDDHRHEVPEQLPCCREAVACPPGYLKNPCRMQPYPGLLLPSLIAGSCKRRLEHLVARGPLATDRRSSRR